jgi:hypothetical protein
VTHPHDNTWCRATAAMQAYWRRILGRSPMADVLMALSWLVLALLFTIAGPVLIVYAVCLGIEAMNRPFVAPKTFRLRRDNVTLIHRSHA